MELGVFELGLKNQQLSTIRCFLKIQTEALRLLRSGQSSQVIEKQHLHQWVDIFSKISQVVTSSLRDRTSSSIQAFGHDLAVIALSISCDIIDIICNDGDESKEDALLDESGRECQDEHDEFLRKFLQSVTIIREASFTWSRWAGASSSRSIKDKNKEWAQATRRSEVESSTFKAKSETLSDKEEAGKESTLTGTDFVRQLILQHVKGDKKSLLDVQLDLLRDEERRKDYEEGSERTASSDAFHDSDVFPSWKEITEMILQEALQALRRKEWERVKLLLSLVNISLHDILPFLLKVSFDQRLRQQVLQLTGTIHLPHSLQNASFLEERITELCQTYCDMQFFQVNYECVQSLKDDFVRYISPDVLEGRRTLTSLQNQDRDAVCTTLLYLNETSPLINWIRDGVIDKHSSLVSLPLDGHPLSMEKISSALFEASLFERFPSIPQLLRQAYRNGVGIISDPKFASNILTYFTERQLHDLVLWHPTISKQTLPSTHPMHKISPTSQNRNYMLIQRATEIITGFTAQDQISQTSLWSHPDVSLEVLLSLLFFTDDFNQLDITFINDKVKKKFPIISAALTSSGVWEASSEPPNISSLYYLLRKTTPLKISDIFLWQEKNLIKTKTADMPSFTEHQIENFKGLATNIDTLYFVREGRPCYAFLTGSSHFSPSIASDVVNLACSSGTRRIDIMCSSVIFHEILLQNSWRLRLHLAVANFIAKYAPDFLGLKVRQQESGLTHLLSEVTCKGKEDKDNSGVIRMLNILLAAFERRYPERVKITIDEIHDWDLVHNFCIEHGLEQAVDILIKSAQNDDWLSFVIACQLYDYPKETVISLLGNFNNGCIADHLEKAFRSSSTNIEKETDSPKPSVSRDSSQSRHSLYMRIGVNRKSMPVMKPSGMSTPTYSSFDDDTKSMTSDMDALTLTDSASILSRGSGETVSSDGDWNHVPNDFYHLVIMAQKKTSHPCEQNLLSFGNSLKNHIVVLLSASMSGSIEPSFDVFCYWLLAAFKPCPLPNFTPQSSWSQNKFLDLIRNGLRAPNNLRILRLGLQLFEYQDNPLYSLIQFLIEYILEKKLAKSVDALKTFQEAFWKFDSDVQSNPLENITGLSVACVAVLESCIKSIGSFYECRLLIRHLDFARVHSMFPTGIKVVNFNQLSRMCQAVVDTPFELPVGQVISLNENSEKLKQVIGDLVKTLQLNAFYSQAIQLSSLSGLSLDEVYLTEYQFKSEKNGSNFSFWKDSLNFLLKQLKTKKALISFLIDWLDSPIISKTIKCLLLAELFDLLLSTLEFKCLAELECQLYLAIIDMESEDCNIHEKEYTWQRISVNLRRVGCHIHEIPTSVCETNASWKHDILDSIVIKMVAVDPSFAVRFSSSCCHHCKDADVLQLCHSLVSKKTLSDGEVILCQRLIGVEITPNTQLEENRILSLIDSISSLSRSTCSRMILMYKISQALGKSFDEVCLECDPLSLLSSLLSGDTNCLSLAKEFVSTQKVDDKTIAELVFKEMISSFNRDIKDGSSIESTASGVGGDSFLSFLRLFNDPSVLGRHILVHLKGGMMDDQPLSTAVELYIRAHDCFSMCSDIEGISLVLRNTKLLVMQQLSPANDYYAMIRLLTGIGRYSEMTYIFDILKEHHKFELLLGKRIEKVPQLRVALLDSLKGDKDMYPLVALNFSMHREIAEMLEDDARKAIRSLSFKKTLDSGNMKEILERSLADFVDASDSYAKANCYSQSRRCSQWADLVALQIHLLSKGADIMSLSSSQVTDFVTAYPNCSEAWIVAEAYGFRNWASAIFQNVVKKGDWGYFREFCALSGPPSPSLLDDILSKYQTESSRSSPSSNTTMEGNIAKLLNSCRNVESVQRLKQKIPSLSSSNRQVGGEGEDNAFLQDLLKTGGQLF